MQATRGMKHVAEVAGSLRRAFASATEGGAPFVAKYNPQKGPKAAYVPADARRPSDNAKDLFRRLRQESKSRSATQSNSSFTHTTKESTGVIGGSRDVHGAAEPSA